MKTKFFAVLLIIPLLLAIFGNSLALAQSELFFGQSHFYTVVFRGNGEAIVFGKIVVTNSGEAALGQFSLEIPKINPTELAIFQQKPNKICLKYDELNPQRPCLQSSESNYPNYDTSVIPRAYSPPSSPSDYKKITYAKSGNLYRFALPDPIEPQKTGTIIFAYAGQGYVKKTAGLFKFSFETPKVAARIQQIRVAVDVDSDLFLKGQQSEVNYNAPFQEVSRSPAALSSPELDRISSNIGAYGPLVKEAKNLAPNESFSVKGEYAKSRFRLYLSSWLLAFLIIGAILVAIYYLRRYLEKRGSVSESPNQVPAGGISIVNITNASAGLLSAGLVVVLTLILQFLSRSDFFRNISGDFFGLIMIITILLLYVLVIFGPALLVGTKHGTKAALSVLITEFLWFVILLMIYILLFQSGLTTDIFPQPPVMY